MKQKKPTKNLFIQYAFFMSLSPLVFAQSQQQINQCLSPSETQATPPQSQSIADKLNWKKTHNLCGGHFLTPFRLLQHPNPPINLYPLHFKIKTLTQFKNKKTSQEITCSTNNTFTQPGREIYAGKALTTKINGKIQHIKMADTCSLHEASTLFKAKQGDIDFQHNTFYFYNSTFRFRPKSPSPSQPTYWGKAKKIEYAPNEAGISLTDASCSTCNPTNASWTLKAKEIKFNKKKNKAEIHNAVLRLFHLPILYIPYLSFPIIITPTTRQSGFLFPSISRQNKYGYSYQQPYYWAPQTNFDVMLTPGYYQKNGFQINSFIRFLTQRSKGHIFLSYFPKDRGFDRYKESIISQGGTDAYTNALKKMSDARGYFNLQTDFQLSPSLYGNVTLNYTTDPYYILDYTFPNASPRSDYLMNKINLTYLTKHWRFYNYIQGFQTLHQIGSSAITNQYQHLPEMDFVGQYDHVMAPLFFKLNGQYVNFNYQSDFTPLTTAMPIGQRLHIKPTVGLRFSSASGFFTPHFSLFSTIYKATSAIDAGTKKRSRIDSENIIPITSIDSGLYFEKKINWEKKELWQTLEPRVKYTYIPYKNQNLLPNFNTEILPFNFNSLFSDNAFTGVDRLQNTNQLSFGLTTQLFSQSDAAKLVEADIGLAYYFSPRKVCLTNTCQTDNQKFSPLVLQLDYSPNANITLSSSTAWNFEQKNINNILFSLKYTKDKKHVFNIGLLQTHAFGSLVSLGFALPINQKIQALSFWEYNLRSNYTENGFAGIQYNSCCWSAQILYSLTFQGENVQTIPSSNRNQFNHGIYFQFVLKGLGSFGDSEANQLISSGLPNFKNNFIS